ncbi:MAG TPA: RNB domain-containing ribonuclease [Acidimicrobiales bacterium]|nr:RNB domain-containing ribonuclease [Acidimicrobiales bacterium]
MPAARISLPDEIVADVAPAWESLRLELGVPDAFAPAVLAEADAAAASLGSRLPELDRTDLPLVTIDPEGARDLDQAVAIERRSGGGYRVHYAIADVASFAAPGGAVDVESHRRGMTLYAPDRNVPVHPEVLSTGAASLLPGELRPALLWTLDLDAGGALVGTDVRRAQVRSRRQLAYPEVQRLLDTATADESLDLLREVGRLRQARAAERGAVHLPTLEQEVEVGTDGPPRLVFRAPLPCEDWNAEISLLTGMAAAAVMLQGRVGLLRTLPPPEPTEVVSVRRSALALGLAWPEDATYAAVISALDPNVPEAAALLTFAARLLRGAAYTAFDGTVPAQVMHSAVAAPYAHATAPLRRLADRYVGEVCVALVAGADVPPWAGAGLSALPAEMAAAGQRAHALERAVVDLAEAVVLAARVGEEFDAVVVESGERKGVVQLRDPAVRARCDAPRLPLGHALRVRLAEVDVTARRVVFRPA